MSDAKKLIDSISDQLNVYAHYAATDLYHFPKCANPGTDAPLKQYLTFRDSGLPAPRAWFPPVSPYSWNLKAMKLQHDEVEAARAGACTNFGVAAAYVLGRSEADLDTGTRIEVVGWSGALQRSAHVYVVAGRSGSYSRDGNAYILPTTTGWGKGWYIVDGWAGAMGWDVVYREGSRYPFVGMLTPLQVFATNVPPS